MPPRDRTHPLLAGAEERFYRYHREALDFLGTARGKGDRGRWDEATTDLTALAQTVAALTGVTRELHLLTMLTEER
jgi:hypothetical protein